MLNLHKNYDNQLLPQNKSFDSFKLDGTVWKMLAHPSKPVLYIETRKAETRETGFVAIDIERRQVLWNKVQMEPSWWLGLEAVTEELVLLHAYTDIQNPEHKGIFAIDGNTGKKVWEHKEYTFAGFSKKQLLMYPSGRLEEGYSLADLKGGGVVIAGENVETDELPAHVKISNAIQIYAEQANFFKVATFILQSVNKEAITMIDYLEYQDHLVLAFYTKQDDALINWLLLANREGKVLFCNEIENKLMRVGKDAFFIFFNHIVCIKNKSELLTYKITK